MLLCYSDSYGVDKMKAQLVGMMMMVCLSLCIDNADDDGGGGDEGDEGDDCGGGEGDEDEQSEVHVLSNPGVGFHILPKRLLDDQISAKLNSRGRSCSSLCSVFVETDEIISVKDRAWEECKSNCLISFGYTLQGNPFFLQNRLRL